MSSARGRVVALGAMVWKVWTGGVFGVSGRWVVMRVLGVPLADGVVVTGMAIVGS